MLCKERCSLVTDCHETDVTVLWCVSWQLFGGNPMFPFRETDVKEPTSVSWQILWWWHISWWKAVTKAPDTNH